MPIVIARAGDMTGANDVYPQEKIDAAWGQIIRNWAEKNADTFRDLLEREASEKHA